MTAEAARGRRVVLACLAAAACPHKDVAMSTTSPGEPGSTSLGAGSLIPTGGMPTQPPQTDITRAKPPEANSPDRFLKHLADLESDAAPNSDPINLLGRSLVLATAYEVMFSFSEKSRRSVREQLSKHARLPMNQVRDIIPRVDELHDADLARKRFYQRLEKVISRQEREAHVLASRAQLSTQADRTVIMAPARLADQLAEIDWDQGARQASARLGELLDECQQAIRELDALAAHALEKVRGAEAGGKGKASTGRGEKHQKGGRVQKLDPLVIQAIEDVHESGVDKRVEILDKLRTTYSGREEFCSVSIEQIDRVIDAKRGRKNYADKKTQRRKGR